MFGEGRRTGGDEGAGCAKLCGGGAGGGGGPGQEKSQAVGDELRAQWGDRVDGLTAGTNHAAADADLVVLATVWDAAVATAEAHAGQLAGKAVISMANGLVKEGR